MVCAKCEKKLAKSSTSSVAAVDMWKSASDRSADRAKTVGANKLLQSKARYSPYAPAASGSGSKGGALGKKEEKAVVGKCSTCGVRVATAGAKYCQGCSYKNGLCSQCGKKILDTSGYKMSSK
ncbi:hypothetical protein JCM8547_008315 [Rhodosporidiobolus lusitaniae]